MQTTSAQLTSTSHQLRYYIALGAPPIRRPVDGKEPFMRPEVGFNPSWFHKHCGIDFSERWHEDPDFRLTCHEIMRAEIRRRFPGRAIGGVTEDGPPDLLTGVHGSVPVPLMFGQSAVFYPDKWPAPHGEPLSDEQVDELTPVDTQCSPVFQRIVKQVDRIEQLTGTAVGFLNWQGVLNTAFRLRGQQIFVDLLTEPQRAHHVFECVATTMVDGVKALYRRQEEAGVDYRFATIANCVVNMVSPDIYAEHVLPFDRRIRDHFEHFAVHNCAWVVDPYMDAYATIANLGYLDMGITSDLKRAKELFPDTRRTVLYTSMDLANKAEHEMRADFARIAAEFAPCDVGLPDIEADVPDERVKLAMDLCAEFSGQRGA